MTASPEGLLAEALDRMTAVDSVCYCPCVGRDIVLAMNWLGAHLGRFVFCDSGYRRQEMTARGAAPVDWRSVNRGPDVARWPASPTDQPGTRAMIETWRRPDGSAVTLEFLAARAEEQLTSRFAAGTISALLHINDGTGEGGSDLWFLGSPGRGQAEASRCLLPVVAERLTDDALVITDGALTDPEFALRQPFRRCGRLWAPLAPLENKRFSDRQVTVWRTTRESGP